MRVQPEAHDRDQFGGDQHRQEPGDERPPPANDSPQQDDPELGLDHAAQREARARHRLALHAVGQQGERGEKTDEHLYLPQLEALGQRVEGQAQGGQQGEPASRLKTGLTVPRAKPGSRRSRRITGKAQSQRQESNRHEHGQGDGGRRKNIQRRAIAGGTLPPAIVNDAGSRSKTSNEDGGY